MSSSYRFTALDVFRGMTVCFMIVVNTPGNEDTVFAPLKHADWNGFTLTDLVFPSFLFAVGNSISFASEKWNQMKQWDVLFKIFKRTFLIFLLGFLLQWLPRPVEINQYVFKTFSTVRILGVLQRIALVFCLASLLVYYLKPKAILITAIILLLVYWGIFFLFTDGGAALTMTGNAVTKFDTWLMGEKHMPREKGIPFEGQGWLGTFSAVVNVLAGFLAGRFIRQKGKLYEGIAGLFVVGFALFALACFWNLGFPINKKLWTSSYALYTIGLDCMIIASIIYVIDFWGKIKWTYFFEVFGKNPLFIYLFAEVAGWILYSMSFLRGKPLGSWLFENVFRYTGMYFGSLLLAISFMLLCWLVGWWMDRRKIYVKL